MSSISMRKGKPKKNTRRVVSKQSFTSETAAHYLGFRYANPKGIYTTKQRRYSGNKGGLQTVFREEKVWPCKTPKIVTKRIYHHPL